MLSPNVAVLTAEAAEAAEEDEIFKALGIAGTTEIFRVRKAFVPPACSDLKRLIVPGSAILASFAVKNSGPVLRGQDPPP